MSEIFSQQPEQVAMFAVNHFGGQNSDDPLDSLIYKSHAPGGGMRWQQAPGIGLQSPDTLNVDFYKDGIGKRKGSVLYGSSGDLATLVTAASDTVLAHCEYTNPGGSTYLVVAGAKALYTNQSGSWARIKHMDGSSAYTHAATAAKITLVKGDGHLLIGADNGNSIQVYRTGDALDDQLRNDTTGTTVDASSASGQKVLNVAATTMFKVHDRIVIDEAGTPEYGYVASISAGVSVTLVSNLGATYTTETVSVLNLYKQARDATLTSEVTGSWTTSTYLLAMVHDRLCMSTGNNYVIVSPGAGERTSAGALSGIWDAASASQGFYNAPGNVKAMASFLLRDGGLTTEKIILFTTAGTVLRSGMESYDEVDHNRSSQEILNHASFAVSENWIYYLTRNGNIRAVSGASDIDIGRRLKTLESDGPLDGLSVADSLEKAFGVDDPQRRQVLFWYTTSSAYTNDRCAVVDLKQNEPVAGELPESYELRVRLLDWRIDAPATYPWFQHACPISGSLIGILRTGYIYTIHSGYADLDSVPINSYWNFPLFDGGAPALGKKWLRLHTRWLPKGEWNITRETYVDRNDSLSDTADLLMNNGSPTWDNFNWDEASWGDLGVVKHSEDVSRYNEVISFKFSNYANGQEWVLTALELWYKFGAAEAR